VVVVEVLEVAVVAFGVVEVFEEVDSEVEAVVSE
jgi:hypothetical protein